MIGDVPSELLWGEQDPDELRLVREWLLRPPGARVMPRRRAVVTMPTNASYGSLVPRDAPAVEHSERCVKYQCEVTFHRWYVVGWMAVGVCPPPWIGSWDNPAVVALCLASRERRDLDGPTLMAPDEAAIRIQQARWEAMLVAETRRFSGHDPIVICDCGADHERAHA